MQSNPFARVTTNPFTRNTSAVPSPVVPSPAIFPPRSPSNLPTVNNPAANPFASRTAGAVPNPTTTNPFVNRVAPAANPTTTNPFVSRTTSPTVANATTANPFASRTAPVIPNPTTVNPFASRTTSPQTVNPFAVRTTNPLANVTTSGVTPVGQPSAAEAFARNIVKPNANAFPTAAPTYIVTSDTLQAAPDVFPILNNTQEDNIVFDAHILRATMNVWNGTPQHIVQLLNITIDGKQVVNMYDRDNIMEIINMLVKDGFDKTYEYLSGVTAPQDIIWNQPAMDEGRNKIIREISVEQMEEKGTVGAGKCRRCPSTELVFATKQTRSGDEPETVTVRCVKCSCTWRQ